MKIYIILAPATHVIRVHIPQIIKLRLPLISSMAEVVWGVHKSGLLLKQNIFLLNGLVFVPTLIEKIILFFVLKFDKKRPFTKKTSSFQTIFHNILLNCDRFNTILNCLTISNYKFKLMTIFKQFTKYFWNFQVKKYLETYLKQLNTCLTMT